MPSIGHYDNPYRVAVWSRDLPAGTRCEPLLLDTADRALAQGWLYSRGGERTVVCLVLLEVAAGVRAMRARYERVVLYGNSGGGSLDTLYLHQAIAPTGERLRDTAAVAAIADWLDGR